jgi:hypothetical protein
MKLFLTAVTVAFLAGSAWAQGVGVNETGADPHPSAILDASSTNKGFLPPRMTVTERNEIATVSLKHISSRSMNDFVLLNCSIVEAVLLFAF